MKSFDKAKTLAGIVFVFVLVFVSVFERVSIRDVSSIRSKLDAGSPVGDMLSVILGSCWSISEIACRKLVPVSSIE